VDPTQYQHCHQYDAYQPHYEQAHQKEGKTRGEAQEEQTRPHVILEGPTELSLLPNFGKHVACRLWDDVQISIIV